MAEKHDAGKVRWGLMPWEELEDVARVFMFGAEKYSDFGWQQVENGEQRYQDATIRHIVGHVTGNEFDRESGEQAYAHAVCSLLIAMWHAKRRRERERQQEEVALGHTQGSLTADPAEGPTAAVEVDEESLPARDE